MFSFASWDTGSTLFDLFSLLLLSHCALTLEPAAKFWFCSGPFLMQLRFTVALLNEAYLLSLHFSLSYEVALIISYCQL